MAEFKIGDVLMYSSVGLVKIVDVRREYAFGEEREYYILDDLASSSNSQIFVPRDNERLISNMRELLSKEEALSLLSKADREDIVWHKDNRARSECFKKIIESGDRAKLLSLISAINKAKEERLKEGKKSFILDENALDKAMRLIAAEFSFVLEKTADEIRNELAKI